MDRLVATTAAAAITVGLKLPLPHLDPIGTNEHGIQSILVLGGSSGVGAMAIQYLRLALPEATVLATSSKQHHDRLVSLGANKCFERMSQDDPTDIRAVTTRGAGVDAILDTVGAAGIQPAVFAALSPNGPRIYSQVMTGAPIKVPETVSATVVFARQIFGTRGGQEMIPGLARLVECGQFKLPTDVEIVGNGFESIQPALERLMHEGVSGNKFVVSV